MHSPYTYRLLAVASALFFGVWGFVVYRYPKFFVSLDIAYKIKWPSNLRLIRTMGIVWMAFGVILMILMSFLKT